MTSDERVTAITEAAAAHAVERHDPHAARRRFTVLIAGAVLLASLLGGGTWVALKIAELQGQVDTNAVIAQRLGDQVEQLGGTPVVQPPAVDDPDPDDADPDDPERQDPEVQDPEHQDGEQQDPEIQDPEVADVEHDDPDPDDPEVQDEEIQDPEIDDEPKPGPPPAGWTWVDGDGRTQSCTRTGGPDTAPTYTCTAEPPPETVPGLPPGIGG